MRKELETLPHSTFAWNGTSLTRCSQRASQAWVLLILVILARSGRMFVSGTVVLIAFLAGVNCSLLTF